MVIKLQRKENIRTKNTGLLIKNPITLQDINNWVTVCCSYSSVKPLKVEIKAMYPPTPLKLIDISRSKSFVTVSCTVLKVSECTLCSTFFVYGEEIAIKKCSYISVLYLFWGAAIPRAKGNCTTTVTTRHNSMGTSSNGIVFFKYDLHLNTYYSISKTCMPSYPETREEAWHQQFYSSINGRYIWLHKAAPWSQGGSQHKLSHYKWI